MTPEKTLNEIAEYVRLLSVEHSSRQEAEIYVRSLANRHDEYSRSAGAEEWLREYSEEVRNLLLRGLGRHMVAEPADIETLPIGSVISDTLGRSWIRESRLLWIGSSRIRTSELVHQSAEITFYIRYRHTPGHWAGSTSLQKDA